MKLLLLAAFIAAVASSSLTQSNNWPWQVGREYLYDVNTFTWTSFNNSVSNGNAFKTQFIIRVIEPGHLFAKLKQPMYAPVQEDKIFFYDLPTDLKYQPINITDQTLEIFVDGGRVEGFIVPDYFSVAHENLLKGLLSTLQVDISANKHVDHFPNNFDKKTFQGLFKKMEIDITGECETLYSVSPLHTEWRRENPKFASLKDPVEIIKEKNDAACKNHTALYHGVPEGALWNGIAYGNDETQFIKRTFEQRLVVGKLGDIVKAEAISSVFVNPLLFGKQKAEVFSYVGVLLSDVQEISGEEWKKTEAGRLIQSLVFTMSESMFIPKVTDQSIANAQKLLQDITPLLQTPNKLPKADFLSKFSVLVRVIASLNSEQLNVLTNSIEIAKSSKNFGKIGMWIIYRDAVAQAGTIAAFDQIKTWILNKKIQGEEAGQLLSGISASLRYHTKKTMADFFDLAINPVVLEQQYLNNSALLAATKYIRFGKDNSFIVDSVIPRLSKELKQAVENGDSNKAQVYVRVLGNLAHPQILQTFAPYLDGSIVVTKYLRIQIVASLKTLANLRNDQVRAALYSIIRNTAEPYEVRVMAALNIFMAFPTAEMMQVMAHMTNDDPSTQVRAVLVNGISFAAELKDPRFSYLAKTAEFVKPFVSKEKFGYRLSTDSLFDSSDDEIAYFRELSYIGSEDNFFPKYHRSALRSRGTGWTEESQVTLSVSGVQQLLEYIAQLIYEPERSSVDLKFAKKFAEKLSMKREPREPLQGALFLENLNQQKLITFSEDDLKAFIASTVKNIKQLIKGVDVQYTKILNHKQTYVIFPMIAGVPFIFEYNEPLMISFNGQVKMNLGKSDKGISGFLHKQLNITYARNLDGSVGFLDTLMDEYVTVGVINKLQLYFPTNLNTIIEKGQVKLNFILPEQDANLFHFSVWPYTSLQKTDTMLTVSQNPSTKYIERPSKEVDFDFKVPGFLTGIAFHLQGYSFSTDIQDIKDIFDTDFLTSFEKILYQKDIAKAQFNLKYLTKESANKEVTFRLFYDTLYDLKETGELGPAAPVKDISANSEARRDELVKRAATGIKSAQVQLYDFSATFSGKWKIEYLFTAALADSHVDNKTQGVFFIYAIDQINANFKSTKPKIVPLNFDKALNNPINVTYESDILFGNTTNIHLKGYGLRSKKYTELLRNDPMGKKCLQDTRKNNFYQMDCYKMIIKAHAPDYFKLFATYKDVNNEYLNIAYNIYGTTKQILSWEQEENILKTTDDGKLELVMQAFYDDNYMNFELLSTFGELRLNNIKILEHYPYSAAIYAPITETERSHNYYYGYQHMPYCAVDNSKVHTFSGRSYDYSITSTWHAIMVDVGESGGTLQRNFDNV